MSNQLKYTIVIIYVMKYIITFFLLSGFITDNNKLKQCSVHSTNICCKNKHAYKVIMKCNNNINCDYLNITKITNKSKTMQIGVKKSTMKGYLFDAELENATILELHKNLIIFVSTINKYHNFIRYNINENLCVKLTFF